MCLTQVLKGGLDWHSSYQALRNARNECAFIIINLWAAKALLRQEDPTFTSASSPDLGYECLEPQNQYVNAYGCL